ncbi:hypothetical protein BDQ12DRAFT_744427 [Crucibulum laeve]|uniref:Uncharacterized protein n=1 Tax=Crucibulum laeve TaxID=68775 RepID=A0A5C3M148_9AGAR|nr:hypothetical protein BDQ12DRAFT_744427 [Crucibulum laeve]
MALKALYSGLHPAVQRASLTRPPYPQRDRVNPLRPVALPVVQQTSTLQRILAAGEYRAFPIGGIQHSLPAVIEHAYPPPPAHLFMVRLSHDAGDYQLFPFPTINGIPTVNSIIRVVVRVVEGEDIMHTTWEVDEVLAAGAYIEGRPGRLRVDGRGMQSECINIHNDNFAKELLKYIPAGKTENPTERECERL